jgi:DNA invertase Pin-like site-specific DNA recombinase
MAVIGYARVSTDGQSLESQETALRAAGAERVFAEKISGAITDRRALSKALAALGPGDTLLVTRLDRLARSTRDLLNTLAKVGEAGAGFRSLADAWADTTTPHGKLMITVLGGLAEFERSLILARTGDGRARAMARGVRFGRKPKLSSYQVEEALARREAANQRFATYAATAIGATYKEVVNVLLGMVEEKVLARGVRDQTDLDILVLIRCMRGVKEDAPSQHDR